MKHVPQPGADISADNADDDIADQAKGSALQDSCGQPTGNRSDDQRDDQALHCVSPRKAASESLTATLTHAGRRNYGFFWPAQVAPPLWRPPAIRARQVTLFASGSIEI